MTLNLEAWELENEREFSKGIFRSTVLRRLKNM